MSQPEGVGGVCCGNFMGGQRCLHCPDRPTARPIVPSSDHSATLCPAHGNFAPGRFCCACTRERVEQERDQALGALRCAREDFADVFRHHTRAIHALKGRVEYPEGERQATAERAKAALRRIDSALEQNHKPEGATDA